MPPIQMTIQGRIGIDGHLRLDVATPLPQSDVEVVVTIHPANGTKADFSDLVGRLAWRGDAVAEQRGLRNEW